MKRTAIKILVAAELQEEAENHPDETIGDTAVRVSANVAADALTREVERNAADLAMLTTRAQSRWAPVRPWVRWGLCVVCVLVMRAGAIEQARALRADAPTWSWTIRPEEVPGFLLDLGGGLVFLLLLPRPPSR